MTDTSHLNLHPYDPCPCGQKDHPAPPLDGGEACATDCGHVYCFNVRTEEKIQRRIDEAVREEREAIAKYVETGSQELDSCPDCGMPGERQLASAVRSRALATFSELPEGEK